MFQSSDDIEATLAAASRQCLLGAGCAAAGCAAFLAGAAATFPPAVFGMLCVCGLGNTYAFAVVAQRVLRNVAARHVERIAVLPTELQASPAAEEDEPGGLASLLINAAPVSERLAATRELRLEIRTAGADRWVTLVDPTAEDEHVASFGDLCARLRLLHIDVDVGICGDRPLLDALTKTPKVPVDERVEAREGGGVPSGPMLSEVTIADVLQGETAVGAESPVTAIARLARRARNGGIGLMVAGALFFIGENARDPDGVARWTNLWWLDF